MPGAETFVLRIRAAFWGESYDADEALNDVLNRHVRDGQGLSFWRHTNDAERGVGVAIMVEKRPDPAKGNLQVIEIDGDLLKAGGFEPRHTPDNADSTHQDARDLHYDIEGLNKDRGEALRDLLHASGVRRDYRKDDLHPILTGEVDRFLEESTRTRIRDSLRRHEPKSPK